MSEYRPSYVSPPRDSAPYRSDRSFPKGLGSHNYSTTDLSYEDLKYEYSKVLNHLDSIRQDRNLYKNPLESVSATKGYSKLLSPSTSERSPYRSTGKITTTTYNRFVEPEKRVIELEQEVSEMKKLLESYKLRIMTLQKENHEYQERIKDFKKIDHCNKQLGFEMKTLDHEILAITKQMKELEQENARLIAEKNSTDSSSAQNKELPKNLKKYVKYIFHLLTTLKEDHFGRFCFEERFTTEDELNKLVEAKDSDKLVMQSFRYIADLLLNISSTAKSSTESAIIRSHKEGQAYLVDLNETYLSVPRVRATTPEITKELIQPRKKSPEVRRAYSKAVLSELEQKSPRQTEEERRRYSEKPEEGAKKQQYIEDKKFEERRRQYEDTRVKQGNENDERRPSAKEKVDDRQYASESRGLQRDTSQYIRESDNYLEKGQRQSLAQTGSQRNTNKDEYSYKDANEGLNRQERRYTETDNRQYASKRDEEPTYKRDERRTENVQERYTHQEEHIPLDRDRPQERQYLTKEEAYPAKRVQREENISLNNRSRPTSPERQPTPEMRYSESLHQSRTEPDNQIYEGDYYTRRIATEEAPTSSYYGDIPAAPARAHSKSPNSRSDKRPPTNRESSPKIQYQSQGYQSNQARPSEEYYQSNNKSYTREPEEYEDHGNRRGQQQQYEIAPKPSMEKVGQNFSHMEQPGTRQQPELVRKPSHLSETGYQKTGKTEHSFDMVDQEYREAPKLMKKPSSELQHKNSMPTLSLVQRRESKQQEKARSPRQDLGQKQPTVNTASASQLKSPKDIKKSNSMMVDQSSQAKRKSSPGRLTPMSAQNPQSGQSAGKLLSPNSGQVSQIVYKSQKSLQGANYSPISSSKSSKPEINPASIQLTTEEKDLIERENELIQRIRELREKEKELMEKEREISQKTDTQYRSQPRPSGDGSQSAQQARYKEQRQASFKEPSPTEKPPRVDQKKSSKPTIQTSNLTNAVQRDSSNERFYEDAGEPRGERPVAARHDSLSPRNRQEEPRSAGLKSILKNSESGYQGQLNEKMSPHETKYSNNPSSPFRSSFDDPNVKDFDGYSTVQSNDRRNQYASVPENYQKRSYQDEAPSAHSETNHQKRLTFGTHANFEPEFAGSRNYSYVSDRRDVSPDEQVSPNKQQEPGTHYASFKVSFGRTESRWKKSPSPEAQIPSILDVPRRKRVSPSPSKYDVKQAIEYRDLNASGKKEHDESGRKGSSVIVRDILESQREGEENERELPKTPEKKGNAGHKLRSILVEQKWEIVKE